MISGPRLLAAVVPARGGDDGGAPLSERGWRATVVGLHVVFVLMLGIAAATTQVGRVEGERWVVLATLGVLAVAYLVLGAPALADEHPARAVGYLTVLVAAFAVLGWQAPELLFLLFLAYPQVWFLVESARPGVVWTVLLALASTVGPAISWSRGTEPVSAVLQTGVGLTFSVALGIWVSRVLEQSRQRATLIRELERTRAELATAHHERGVLAERERLAREVHDTLAQGYTSIVVLAQTAAAQLADPAAARERLALIEEVARDNLAEARAVVAAFAPAGLDDSSLVDALHRLTERFGRETGLATRVDTSVLGDTGPALRRDEEIVLLRATQEALTNVRRHAAASAVVVRLTRVEDADGGQVAVHVEDDGTGFEPRPADDGGLAGLRDRVTSVGGELDVVSAPGAGTRVTVRVPQR